MSFFISVLSNTHTFVVSHGIFWSVKRLTAGRSQLNKTAKLVRFLSFRPLTLSFRLTFHFAAVAFLLSNTDSLARPIHCRFRLLSEVCHTFGSWRGQLVEITQERFTFFLLICHLIFGPAEHLY